MKLEVLGLQMKENETIHLSILKGFCLTGKLFVGAVQCRALFCWWSGYALNSCRICWRHVGGFGHLACFDDLDGATVRYGEQDSLGDGLQVGNC